MPKTIKLTTLVRTVIKTNCNAKKYNEDELIDEMYILCEEVNKKANRNIQQKKVIKIISRYLYLGDDNIYFFDIMKRNKDCDECFTMLTENMEDYEDDISELEQLDEQFSKHHITESEYVYPKEQSYNIIQRTDEYNGPYGTQWVHDNQVDDLLDYNSKVRLRKYKMLRAIELPEQRSKEWFQMRSQKITASDIGIILGDSKYDAEYTFILKKTIGSTFQSNKYCYHGKKLEEIATMIYEYRMNVIVEEFGLMEHPKYKFLGASPDGICSPYKLDGKHKSSLVGRMLEIKCPLARDINRGGPIKNHICPLHYWDQVQLQLECCDLDECDFLQCKIREYVDKDEFINDTDEREPFRSKKFGFEKGCLIQLIPKKRVNDKYLQTVFDSAIFIYPPKIEMTPYDCDMWIAKVMANFHRDKKYYDYVFDRVIYWRLEDLVNVTIPRDRKWFRKSLPIFRKMWDRVIFFRNNPEKLNLFVRYIESRKRKITKDIMKVADQIININDPNYATNLKHINDKINENSVYSSYSRRVKDVEDKYEEDNYSEFDEYMLSDSDDED